MKRRRVEACGKRRFRDGDEAKIALSTIRSAGAEVRAKTPVRAYECETCKGWHLTSQAS